MVNSNQPDELYEEGFIDNLKNGKLSIQKNVVARYNDTSGKAILQIANEYNTTIAKLDEDEKKAMSEIGSGKSMTSKELAHHKHVLERYLARCQSYAGRLWKYDKLIKKGGVISRDITGVYEQVDKAIRGRIRMVENLIKKCDTITTYDDYSSKKDPFAESTYDAAVVSFMRAYKEYSDAISEYEPLNMSEEYIVEASKDKRDLNKTEMAIIEKHQKNTEAVKKSKNALQKMKDSLSSAMDSVSKSIFNIKSNITHDRQSRQMMNGYRAALKGKPYLANQVIGGCDFKELYRSFSTHITRLKSMADTVYHDQDKYPKVANWTNEYPELFEDSKATIIKTKYHKSYKLKDAIDQIEFCLGILTNDLDREFVKFRDTSMSKMRKLGVNPDDVENDTTDLDANDDAKEYVAACMLVLDTYNKTSKSTYSEFKKVLTAIVSTIKADQDRVVENDNNDSSEDDSDTTESVDLSVMLNMSRSPIRGHI